jgi:hypothetical protein
MRESVKRGRAVGSKLRRKVELTSSLLGKTFINYRTLVHGKFLDLEKKSGYGWEGEG